MRNLIGPLFLLVSCLLFSITGTLQQLAPEGHTPVVITEVRMLLGSLTILAWCLLRSYETFPAADQKLDSIPLPLDNLFCSMYYSGVI